MYDVVIVGGSAAGLSAALVLGRFGRKVLVCDTNRPRNAVAIEAHGFFTRDGTPPAEILRIGREQLQPYPSVEIRPTEIVNITPLEKGFELATAIGETLTARRVLLATGFRDELPPVAGVAHYRARGVYHCPYCDGWEARNKRIVAWGTAAEVYHVGMMLRSLSESVYFFIKGENTLTAEQQATVDAQGIRIYHDEIVAVEGNGDHAEGLRLANGELFPSDAIFVRTIPHQSPLVAQLGVELTEAGHVKVDMFGHTSVPDVFAAGDISTPFQQILFAAASGAQAAAGINTDMVFAQ